MFKHLTLRSGVSDEFDHISSTMFDNEIKNYRTENISLYTVIWPLAKHQRITLLSLAMGGGGVTISKRNDSIVLGINLVLWLDD